MELKVIVFLFLFAGIIQNTILAQQSPYLSILEDGTFELTRNGADFFAKLALDCIEKEYPNKLNQTLPDETMLLSPQKLHPAFYGCYDWHSSVHGHWMLVRLVKSFPDMESADEIIQLIDKQITIEKILQEVSYFESESKSFERMYGWSWLMKLGEELYTWNHPLAGKWYKNLTPLLDLIGNRYVDFLSIQEYPVRTGVHPNTAFGLRFALDYAISAENKSLEKPFGKLP